MARFGREVPLKKLWTSNLLLSSLVHLTLLVISTMSGNPVLFLLCFFTTSLSCLVLVDWKYLTLILNSVGQAKWQKEALKWLFPIFCLHSVCVTLTVIGLKRRYKIRDEYPLREVISLLKDCDAYFSENRRQWEKNLEAKKLENEMRKVEIQKEEEVAKKIVDGLYGFTNRSNFPELEPNVDKSVEKNLTEEDTLTNKNNSDDKEVHRRIDEPEFQTGLEDDQNPNINVHISIPEDL